MKRMTKGFTLMELLIVIGVLGILAAGLLAAIDPFEQLKKARDTNNRSAAIELLGASQRYYASHTALPWFTTVATCIDANNPVITLTADASLPYPVAVVANSTSQATNAQVNACISNTLVADGELKTTFFQGLGSTLYMGSGSTTHVIVCFAPEGKAARNDAATKYLFTAGGAAGTGTVSEPAGGCTAAQKEANQCLQCFE